VKYVHIKNENGERSVILDIDLICYVIMKDWLVLQ